MAGRSAVFQGLGATVQALKNQLGKLGIASPAVQQVRVSGPGVTGVRSLATPTQMPAGAKQIAEILLPNALVTGGLTLASTGDPGQALLATGLDTALGAGALGIAGRFAPGRLGTLSYKNKKGEQVSDLVYRPSMVQEAALGVAPLGTYALMAGMAPPYQPQNQQQVAVQQEQQRIDVNALQQQLNIPGTQFQVQGLPTRVLQGQSSYVPPNVLDPYGLSRGSM